MSESIDRAATPYTVPDDALVRGQDGWLLVIRPIVLDGQHLGHVMLYSDLSELHESLWRFYRWWSRCSWVRCC